MPQTIKIDFVDFWPDLFKNDNYFYHVLAQKYSIVLDDKDPDLVFMSCYSMDKERYRNHRCKKIFFTGENRGLQSVAGNRWIDPIFEYDLTLSFEETQEKNVYLPLFVLWIDWFDTPYDHNRDMAFLVNLDDLLSPFETSLANQELLRTKTNGCCFLAKNPAATERISFCKEAQKQFPVDCPGPVLNNCPQIGGRGDQIQKINFIKKYRSIVAFENSKHPGYLTEKVLHGLGTKCVPIYWGANRVFDYFNKNNIIQVSGVDDWPRAIQRVKQILENDGQYLAMVSEPAMKRSVLDEFSPERILRSII
jgi:hypothetical protein